MGNAWASWKHGFQFREDPEPGQGVALLGGYGPPPWGIGEEQPGACSLSLWGPPAMGWRVQSRAGRSGVGMWVTPSAGTGPGWCELSC